MDLNSNSIKKKFPSEKHQLQHISNIIEPSKINLCKNVLCSSHYLFKKAFCNKWLNNLLPCKQYSFFLMRNVSLLCVCIYIHTKHKQWEAPPWRLRKRLIIRFHINKRLYTRWKVFETKKRRRRHEYSIHKRTHSS